MKKHGSHGPADSPSLAPGSTAPQRQSQQQLFLRPHRPFVSALSSSPLPPPCSPGPPLSPLASVPVSVTAPLAPDNVMGHDSTPRKEAGGGGGAGCGPTALGKLDKVDASTTNSMPVTLTVSVEVVLSTNSFSTRMSGLREKSRDSVCSVESKKKKMFPFFVYSISGETFKSETISGGQLHYTCNHVVTVNEEILKVFSQPIPVAFLWQDGAANKQTTMGTLTTLFGRKGKDGMTSPRVSLPPMTTANVVGRRKIDLSFFTNLPMDEVAVGLLYFDASVLFLRDVLEANVMLSKSAGDDLPPAFDSVYISFKCDTPLLTDKQRNRFNPLSMTVVSVTDLPCPDDPARREALAQLFSDVYVEYTMPGSDLPLVSQRFRHATALRINHTHVHLVELFDSHGGSQLYDLFEATPLVVHVHDRDKRVKCGNGSYLYLPPTSEPDNTRADSPTSAEDDIATHIVTLASTATKHRKGRSASSLAGDKSSSPSRSSHPVTPSTSQQQPPQPPQFASAEPPTPFGEAKFSLADLCTGETSLKLTAPVILRIPITTTTLALHNTTTSQRSSSPHASSRHPLPASFQRHTGAVVSLSSVSTTVATPTITGASAVPAVVTTPASSIRTPLLAPTPTISATHSTPSTPSMSVPSTLSFSSTPSFSGAMPCMFSGSLGPLSVANTPSATPSIIPSTPMKADLQRSCGSLPESPQQRKTKCKGKKRQQEQAQQQPQEEVAARVECAALQEPETGPTTPGSAESDHKLPPPEFACGAVMGYMECGTCVTVKCTLHRPLAQRSMSVGSFYRAVYIFEGPNHLRQAEELKTLVAKANAAYLGVSSLPQLANYLLTSSQLAGVIMGCVVSDSTASICILEGDSQLNFTDNVIKQINLDTDSGLDKLLFNAQLTFKKPLFTAFSVPVLLWIQLNTDLETILSNPVYYTKDCLPNDCIDGLNRIAELKKITRVYEAKILDAYPTAAMVLAVERKFTDRARAASAVPPLPLSATNGHHRKTSPRRTPQSPQSGVQHTATEEPTSFVTLQRILAATTCTNNQ
eukprot:TRINITY_DN3725_c0_g1_i2.p1 TRINITY_DN3725_c0_g1~~TRINITY_DN3725_c0_g1_i2.p1  ORF type:complete len:1040 (-),score=172.64 TRINITY_DN3725_c0_g1_i2:638-3757(-)